MRGLAVSIKAVVGDNRAETRNWRRRLKWFGGIEAQPREKGVEAERSESGEVKQFKINHACPPQAGMKRIFTEKITSNKSVPSVQSAVHKKTPQESGCFPAGDFYLFDAFETKPTIQNRSRQK